MAQSKNNIITHGMSGMIGDMLVFRQVGGKTIVAKAPKESGKPPTAAQKAVQDRFQQAIIYGKSVMADPDLKESYAQQAGPGQSAYNIAVADFYNAPDIEEVDLSGYTGAVGSLIRVKATDDFGIGTVMVRIENADGSLLEEGLALRQPNGFWYHYPAMVANTSKVGDKIIITASDGAGNKTSETQTL